MIFIIETHILPLVIIIKEVRGEFENLNKNDRAYKVKPLPVNSMRIKETLFEARRKRLRPSRFSTSNNGLKR